MFIQYHDYCAVHALAIQGNIVITLFVSSVYRGLDDVRAQLLCNLRQAHIYDVTAMEEFAAQPHPPLDMCLAELRGSDVVVLLLGPRYGSRLDNGLSYTHAEFREARRLQIPVLAFSLPISDTISEEDKAGLQKLTGEVAEVSSPHQRINIRSRMRR